MNLPHSSPNNALIPLRLTVTPHPTTLTGTAVASTDPTGLMEYSSEYAGAASNSFDVVMDLVREPNSPPYPTDGIVGFMDPANGSVTLIEGLLAEINYLHTRSTVPEKQKRSYWRARGPKPLPAHGYRTDRVSKFRRAR